MVKNKINLNFININILDTIYRLKLNKKLFLKNRLVFKKSTKILHFFINNKFSVYKGLKFKSLSINKYLIFFKFGNFCLTRKPFKYELKVKTKKNFCKR